MLWGGVCIASPRTRELSSSTVSHTLSELLASGPEAIRLVTVAITLGLNGSATRNRSARAMNLPGVGVQQHSHVPVCPNHPRSGVLRHPWAGPVAQSAEDETGVIAFVGREVGQLADSRVHHGLGWGPGMRLRHESHENPARHRQRPKRHTLLDHNERPYHDTLVHRGDGLSGRCRTRRQPSPGVVGHGAPLLTTADVPAGYVTTGPSCRLLPGHLNSLTLYRLMFRWPMSCSP